MKQFNIKEFEQNLKNSLDKLEICEFIDLLGENKFSQKNINTLYKKNKPITILSTMLEKIIKGFQEDCAYTFKYTFNFNNKENERIELKLILGHDVKTYALIKNTNTQHIRADSNTNDCVALLMINRSTDTDYYMTEIINLISSEQLLQINDEISADKNYISISFNEILTSLDVFGRNYSNGDAFEPYTNKIFDVLNIKYKHLIRYILSELIINL